MLQLYNSLTNQKEPFVPIREQQIGIYVCGMTVYDYCHLGHARVMVAFDTAVRYFRRRGYKVTYVRNITDIDDKIIARANELGESIWKLTDRFIGYMNEDLALLGIESPDHEPRATEFIEPIIDMISTLIERGYAYSTQNGDVYYRCRAFAGYGQLSGKNPDELRAGTRVKVDESKEDPLDFALWKSAKQGEPWWDSPWGRGRPGWHIECSAMSTCLLGNHFDIHAGGMDLLFPHHENEIAQSVGATGEPFANVWMHNGHLQIDTEKMSKSLNNFQTIREVLDKDSNRRRMGVILRFLLLLSHYRSPLNYSDDSLDNARLALRRIFSSLDKAHQLEVGDNGTDDSLIERFYAAMDDDLNTPDAVAVLFDSVRGLNRAVENDDRPEIGRLRGTVEELAGALGLLQISPAEFLGSSDMEHARDQIDDLIAARSQARKERNWAQADRIRDELAGLGIDIEDRADGTTAWRRR